MRYAMFIDLDTCAGCGACVMACKIQNGTPLDNYWCTIHTREVGKYPNVEKRVMPYGCMHCAKAPCVELCPTGASFYSGTGAVLIDPDLCVGCKMCMSACPYHVRFFNENAPEDTPYFKGYGLTPFEAMHAADHPRGVVEKCIQCEGRVAEGKEPACVATCITKCRLFGDVDNPESEISKAIIKSGARVLFPEYGTEPGVYYAGKYFEE